MHECTCVCARACVHAREGIVSSHTLRPGIGTDSLPVEDCGAGVLDVPREPGSQKSQLC